MDEVEEVEGSGDRSAGRTRSRRRAASWLVVAMAAALALGTGVLASSAAPASTAADLPALVAGAAKAAAPVADQPAAQKAEPAAEPAHDAAAHEAAEPEAAAPAAPAEEPAGAEADAEPAAEPAEAIHVDIMNFAYDPAALTVNVGDTVVWHNHDSAPHTVTVSDGPEKFDSPTLAQGDTFSYTFTKPGTYSYYCAVHPSMTATVTVEGDGGEEPPPTDTPYCIPSDVAAAIMAHIQHAHLETSPGEQVKQLLNVDDYVLLHTVWIEQVLTPVIEGGPGVVTEMTDAIMAHIKAAHLETSPGQQIKDLLNVDDYVAMHLAWLETVLAPAVEQLTC